jgi:hypothetical protein
MRVEPSPHSFKAKEFIPMKVRVERITRIIAIIVAFVSTFAFFFKILFF